MGTNAPKVTSTNNQTDCTITQTARVTRALRGRLHCMARELTLRIIIEQPPPGVDFGLQKGSGSVYETVQKQRSQGKDLVFEFQPSIRTGGSDSMAALGGPGRT